MSIASRPTSVAAANPMLESAALRRCVGDVAQFLRRHWRRAALYRPRADEQAFADLFSVTDADTLIATYGLRPPAIRLLADGAVVDPATYAMPYGRDSTTMVADQVDPGKIYALFDAGATIILQGLQEYWAPLTRFCRQLDLALTHATSVNAYITPRGAQGFPAHADPHDTIILQVSGRKHWYVYESGDDTAGERTLELELTPGDTLYLPKDLRHEARTTDTFSAHLTVGVHYTTWRTVFGNALADILDTFDEPLPLGYAADPATMEAAVGGQLKRLGHLVGDLDPAALVASRARNFWAHRRPVLAGQLGHLLHIDELGDESVLRRRPDVVCHLRVEGDRLELRVGDRELTLPARVQPVVARILTGAAFTPADLASHLDQPGRLVLVRRLVREGLLEPLEPLAPEGSGS